MSAGAAGDVIVSHRHRFIFLKTKKTAGTSIEAFLASHCGIDDIATALIPPIPTHEPRNDRGVFNPIPEILSGSNKPLRTAWDLVRRRRFYNHMSARIARERLGNRLWSSYFKFCVERNPFDKTLSHFAMLKARGAMVSFDSYLASGRLCHNSPLYTDSDGSLLVDRVILYEDLNDQLASTLGMLGLPFSGSLGIHAKSGYRTDRRHYRGIISGRQRRVIEELFADEIRLHKYTF